MIVAICNCSWTININMGTFFFIPMFYRFNWFYKDMGSEHYCISVINPLNCKEFKTINNWFFYFIKASFKSLSLGILQFVSLLFLMVPERLMPFCTPINPILYPLFCSTFSKSFDTISQYQVDLGKLLFSPYGPQSCKLILCHYIKHITCSPTFWVYLHYTVSFEIVL